MSKIDWETITNYFDEVDTSDKTFSFSKTQSVVKITSCANDNLIYTIGSHSGALVPGDTVIVNENISSFTIRSASGKQSFQVWATDADTEKEYTDNLDSNSIENTVSILVSTPRCKSWTATAGQLVYTFDTDSYTIGQLTVYVGGVPQLPGVNFSEDSTTQFTFLCDASEITDGLNVVAVYR